MLRHALRGPSFRMRQGSAAWDEQSDLLFPPIGETGQTPIHSKFLFVTITLRGKSNIGYARSSCVGCKYIHEYNRQKRIACASDDTP